MDQSVIQMPVNTGLWAGRNTSWAGKRRWLPLQIQTWMPVFSPLSAAQPLDDIQKAERMKIIKGKAISRERKEADARELTTWLVRSCFAIWFYQVSASRLWAGPGKNQLVAKSVAAIMKQPRTICRSCSCICDLLSWKKSLIEKFRESPLKETRTEWSQRLVSRDETMSKLLRKSKGISAFCRVIRHTYHAQAYLLNVCISRQMLKLQLCEDCWILGLVSS